ncbi:MAG TPA: alpha/beta fold hydrolase [Bacteroidia bacterium]|nr:alpha/beta fold hydrolase [Bacteroidia bacterium]
MKLHFRKIGEGAPLIILHGLFGSSDNWQTLAKKFSESGLSVYLVDLRNHGRSPHAEIFSYHDMAEDVFEMMNDEKINSTFIIGHSMGGKTAMDVAMHHPEKISKLVVVDMSPKTRLPDGQEYSLQNKNVASALLEINLNELKSRKEVEAQLAQKISDAGTLQFLLKNLYWKENNSLAWRFNLQAISRNIEKMSDEINFVQPFEKPALFIRGENSNYISNDDEPLIKKYFPRAEIKTAPQSGHWVHADNPQWLLENCLKFLIPNLS